MANENNSCKFNGAVRCYPFERHCDRCGWCPEVAERRLKEFLRKHEASTKQEEAPKI